MTLSGNTGIRVGKTLNCESIAAFRLKRLSQIAQMCNLPTDGLGSLYSLGIDEGNTNMKGRLHMLDCQCLN